MSISALIHYSNIGNLQSKGKCLGVRDIFQHSPKNTNKLLERWRAHWWLCWGCGEFALGWRCTPCSRWHLLEGLWLCKHCATQSAFQADAGVRWARRKARSGCWAQSCCSGSGSVHGFGLGRSWCWALLMDSPQAGAAGCDASGTAHNLLHTTSGWEDFSFFFNFIFLMVTTENKIKSLFKVEG